MSDLLKHRCLNHPTREAVARCPQCTQFHCRECITEHDDRIICASCLKKLAPEEVGPSEGLAGFKRAAKLVCSLVLLWVVFYTGGRMLLRLPSEVHAETLLADPGMEE